MSQINRVPFGLQDLLGSANFGDNPSQLGQVVAPTLGMLPFLSVEKYGYEYAINSGMTDNGPISTMIVPDGELWLLQGVGAAPTANTVTSTAFGCHVGVQVFDVPGSSSPPNSHPIAGMSFDHPAPIALSNVGTDFDGVSFPQMIPLLSGSVVRFVLSGIYGDLDWTVIVNARFLRLKQ